MIKDHESLISDWLSHPLSLQGLKEIIHKWCIDEANDPIVTNDLTSLSFNPTRLLDLLEDNKDDIREILLLAMEEIPKDILKIKESMKNDDVEGIKTWSHKIKGVCVNIGAQALAKEAMKLEEENDNYKAVDFLKALETAYQDLVKEINNYL